MRLVVHDYSGHPGQVQLSRALARRGHTVVHQYCASYTTGRGALERLADDPAGLGIEALSLGREFARYSIASRIRQEIRYGRMASKAIVDLAPDVALLSNLPLLSLLVTSWLLRLRHIPFVFWQQDIYSAAIGSAATRKLGSAGKLIGAVAELFEGSVARRSAAVVPISDSFVPKLRGWRVHDDRITVIPNWAPLEELPQRDRDNRWAAAHGLTDEPVVLYAGTLGLKHDPMLLADAAEALRERARVLVASEGLGREILERERSTRHLDNLTLLDFQQYDDLPDMLGAADILVALLEPDASRYSVPSKVLTYLCAGRAIVAVIPADNAVAEMVTAAKAGVVVAPGDRSGLIDAIQRLLDDSPHREQLARNGREFAERTFNVDLVAARFEAVAASATGPLDSDDHDGGTGER